MLAVLQREYYLFYEFSDGSKSIRYTTTYTYMGIPTYNNISASYYFLLFLDSVDLAPLIIPGTMRDDFERTEWKRETSRPRSGIQSTLPRRGIKLLKQSQRTLVLLYTIHEANALFILSRMTFSPEWKLNYYYHFVLMRYVFSFKARVII